MKSLNATMAKRGFGYVMALTLIVILAGAAGMHVRELRLELKELKEVINKMAEKGN